MIKTDKVLDSRVCVSANNSTLVFKDFWSPSYFLSTIGFKMYQLLLLLNMPKTVHHAKNEKIIIILTVLLNKKTFPEVKAPFSAL